MGISRVMAGRSPNRFKLGWLAAGAIVMLMADVPVSAPAQEFKFPQIIRTRYEATDPKGGHFVIWVEREKIWYGLDSKLYPAAKSVEVTHITPGTGTTTITLIAVT